MSRSNLWKCVSCGTTNVEIMLDLGPQPPGNLFLKNSGDSYPHHPLLFGACRACGLAQLADPMPESMFTANSPWLRYAEPETHLDDLCVYLCEFMETRPVSVCGVGYKDASLLKRLEKAGWANAGTAFSTDAARADVLIARHILEHARNPRKFVSDCIKRIIPNGLLVFEVPGSERVLSENQHCFLWEEHISYFTERTLRSFLKNCGLEILALLEYVFPMENSLIAVARAGEGTNQRASGNCIAEDLGLARNFAMSLPDKAAYTRKVIKTVRESCEKVCLFGAGHLGMKFINFYGLAPYLDIVIDDNERKRGCFLPLSRLPIENFSWLAAHPDSFCLVAINPEKHASLAANHPFFKSGASHWQSIFSGDL